MRRDLRRNTKIVGWLFGSTIVCFTFFSLDVTIDLFEHLKIGMGYSGFELTHLIFEGISVITLGGCMFLLFDYLERLRKSEQDATESLTALRSDFDGLLQQRFEQWDFSSAERDVALLMLRGLSMTEIAELRETRSGTVKVQAHNVFKKSGVNSRVAFTSLFMEEFIDLGATTK